MVPPNGSFPLKIEFTPTRLASAEIVIQTNISQFQYKPFDTRIVARGVSGVVNDTVSTVDTVNSTSAKVRWRQRPSLWVECVLSLVVLLSDLEDDNVSLWSCGFIALAKHI